MQMLLHCLFRPEEPGGLGLTDTTGRNKRCKPSGLHSRGVNRISAEGKHRRSRWPEEPGGLGLADTTGGTGSASRQACMAEA